MKEIIAENLSSAKALLDQFMNDEEQINNIVKASQLFVDGVKQGGQIYACGNGGSMSDAMHFAEELTGNFQEKRPAIPAMAISDPSFMSCTANDYGYDYVFSRFIEGFGNEKATLLAISTSGNSKNIVNAVKAAKVKGMKVVGLTGKDGGELAQLVDVEIRVPYNGYADRIQEIHIKVIHSLIALIEKQLF